MNSSIISDYIRVILRMVKNTIYKYIYTYTNTHI